jgi:type IV pilus assembly protein PilE
MLKLTNKHGFSLIELMLVIALIGILTSIILPTYHHHLTRARRTNATIALTEIASRLEQYYAKNTTYSGAKIDDLSINDNGYKGFYTMAIKADTNTYLIEADPIGTQAMEDASCGTLSVDQNGSKKISGNSNLASCWP